jgi:hypothetical protein
MANKLQKINTVSLEPFPCTQCGKCCRNVHLSDLTSWLDRGDGICKYLNSTVNSCSIYESRPDICQIEKQYKNYYAKKYTWAEFTKLNLEVCEKLP